MCTALAVFQADASLGPHTHPCGEVMVVVEGAVRAQVEDREYLLLQFDALFVPAGCRHAVRNASGDSPSTVHVSFSDPAPTRDSASLDEISTLCEVPPSGAPERLMRFERAHCYELAPGTAFRDLFAKRFGTAGVCGGVGIFHPGTSLPCHTHRYDESITIVQGRAACLVEGRRYSLANCDTACIPEGLPHRFLNETNDPMAMIWVYAGDEPDRDIVDNSWCQFGSLGADS
ncbi:MAG TPA: cupin domain-containing protein [Lacipirellulaceae bacterium]|nr:cupin domain-containing protein [Lacipirellulaceae bacterium]